MFLVSRGRLLCAFMVALALTAGDAPKIKPGARQPAQSSHLLSAMRLTLLVSAISTLVSPAMGREIQVAGKDGSRTGDIYNDCWVHLNVMSGTRSVAYHKYVENGQRYQIPDGSDVIVDADCPVPVDLGEFATERIDLDLLSQNDRGVRILDISKLRFVTDRALARMLEHEGKKADDALARRLQTDRSFLKDFMAATRNGRSIMPAVCKHNRHREFDFFCDENFKEKARRRYNRDRSAATFGRLY